MASRSPYRALRAAGIKMDHRESDLYVLASPEARDILRKAGWGYGTFQSKIDGKTWLDVPFAYEPFWTKRARR